MCRMSKIHIVIPDLFLPQQLAAYASADLRLPALEKLLARSVVQPLLVDTLEDWLCINFGVTKTAIAPLTLLADGLQAGDDYWLRADPMTVSMQRDHTILQADVSLNQEESTQLCESLNVHFAADGLRFFAPHPHRWYLQLSSPPNMQTHPLPQVVGADVHTHLPYGTDALRWHSVFNEIQMLFYNHAVNQAREQRGVSLVSGVWLWGGGKLSLPLQQPFARVAGESELAHAFAGVAGIPCVMETAHSLKDWSVEKGDALIVYEALRGALQHADIAKWRFEVQQFEKNYAQPLLALLNAGQIEQITIDVLSVAASKRFVLTRIALLKIWRRPKSLMHYALQ